MKKVLMLSIVFLFFVGILNAQGVRDNDSYRIYFEWSNSRPTIGNPGGHGYFLGDYISLTAVRTSRAFNVYAKNGSPDADTGAPIHDHSAYPTWYATHGWDVPDADPSFKCPAGPYLCGAPYYMLSIDTYQEKWWLVYTQYPNQPSTAGIANLYVPMSGSTQEVSFNDGTIDIVLKEDGGDWRIWWGRDTPWGFEDVKLQGDEFVAHIDTTKQTCYIVPKKLLKKKPGVPN